MANQQHLDLLKQETNVWNEWREQHPEVRPDLSFADLSFANLSGADLSYAHLSGANLSSANLSRADLSYASLSYARLSGADLSYARLSGAGLNGADFSAANLSETDLGRADLSGANLSEANLTGAHLNYAHLSFARFIGANLNEANLIGADLNEANLNEADLSGAILWSTILGDVDLSLTKGLDTVKHLGPSTIGIDTIYRSKGHIPEIFLQQAGIPDTFLTYMHLLVRQPIEYFSCFISHSSQDKPFCDRLYADLRAKGIRTWYFPEDATWGEPVWGEIDRSIKDYDKLVVVCSEHSLQSGPVLREIERALNREDREGKNILFPIRIDNYLFDGWNHPRKADLLSKVVGDFRGWNRNAARYTVAFEKLVKALKAQQ